MGTRGEVKLVHQVRSIQEYVLNCTLLLCTTLESDQVQLVSDVGCNQARLRFIIGNRHVAPICSRHADPICHVITETNTGTSWRENIQAQFQIHFITISHYLLANVALHSEREAIFVPKPTAHYILLVDQFRENFRQIYLFHFPVLNRRG